MTLHHTVFRHPQISTEPNHALKGLVVYHDAKRVGKVFAVLVDEQGELRYLILRKSGILGKRVLLPVDRVHPDIQARRIDLEGISKRQVAELPEFPAAIGKGRYRLQIRRMAAVEESMSLEAADRLLAARRRLVRTIEPEIPQGLRRNVEPILPISEATPEPALIAVDLPESAASVGRDLAQPPHETLRLYEERLAVDKHSEKVGEVGVYKRVETQTTHFAVPIAKERVVIAHYPSQKQGQLASGAQLQAGEVLRWEIYEETIDLQKQPVVREVINIHKEIQQEVMQIKEPVRREVLDVQTQGNPFMETVQPLLSPHSSQ